MEKEAELRRHRYLYPTCCFDYLKLDDELWCRFHSSKNWLIDSGNLVSANLTKSVMSFWSYILSYQTHPVLGNMIWAVPNCCVGEACNSATATPASVLFASYMSRRSKFSSWYLSEGWRLQSKREDLVAKALVWTVRPREATLWRKQERLTSLVVSKNERGLDTTTENSFTLK